MENRMDWRMIVNDNPCICYTQLQSYSKPPTKPNLFWKNWAFIGGFD